MLIPSESIRARNERSEGGTEEKEIVTRGRK